jgi:hypothetical protein
LKGVPIADEKNGLFWIPIQKFALAALALSGRG